MILPTIFLLLLLGTSASALYSSSDKVVIGTPKNFKKEVLSHPGVVFVEFYAVSTLT